MRSEQILAIEGLEADNDLMNIIATISTFIVAFVVPSAALFVFQALRTAPRELRSIRRDHDRLARSSQAMAAAVSREAGDLRSSLGTAKPPSTDELHRRLLRFEHIAAMNGAPTSLQNEQFDVNAIVIRAIDQLGAESTVRFTRARNPLAVTDATMFAMVATELIDNALNHGDAPYDAKVTTTANGVDLMVSDGGSGLPDNVLRGAVRDEDHGLRNVALDGSLGYGLIAVRRALEAMGGTLDYQRFDGRTRLTASIPSAYASSNPNEEGTLAA